MSTKFTGFVVGLTAVALSLLPMTVSAKVDQLIIDSVQTDIYGTRTFGEVGAYEYITGWVRGSVKPDDPHNAIITDLALAPRNAHGAVDYEATFSLLKPRDMTKASGVLLYNVPNRGNHTLLNLFHVGGAPGDGFLLQRGHVILFSGWQGDLVPKRGLETIRVPVARQADGASVTGRLVQRFANLKEATPTLALPAARRAASLVTREALLTKRMTDDGAVVSISPEDWAFADCRSTGFPGTPDATMISVRGGFDPAGLYELTFLAKDPLVLGLGLAATRDIVAFFRHEAADEQGGANPVAGKITKVIAHGQSQAGNFIRTFLHLGFNQDESGRIVWDGANAHIAGRQNPLNFRFASPGGAVSLYEPGSEPVLWWSPFADRARDRPTAGLLDRARAAGVVPKIFETFGAAELWSLRMSPCLVGTSADRDIPLPSEVRRYYFPGTTHGDARGGFDSLPLSATNRYAQVPNPNPQKETMRALLCALIDWVVKGTAPPASRYPQLDRGELVRPVGTAMGFPVIPGAPLPDLMLNPFFDYDFGPEFNHNDLSGVMTLQPPRIKATLPSLVPRVDADGNEVGGIPSVLHRVPLGSYLGWSVTTDGYYRDRASGYVGSLIPFALTKAERERRGDPRASLEERYRTHAGYVAAVRQAAAASVREAVLLPEDAERLIATAESGNVLKKGATP